MYEAPIVFAELLTNAIHTIVVRERRNGRKARIGIIQDELGYALDRKGGSCIEYWRKGHVPGKLDDLVNLAKELVKRGGLEGRKELKEFLENGGHPSPQNLCDALFPPDAQDAPVEAGDPYQITSLASAPMSVSSQDMLVETRDLAPFVVGPPIKHPQQFFGRERELRRIFSLWKSFPLQHMAIIGPQRSGKTSLLYYLRNVTRTPQAQLRSGQRSDWLSEPGCYRWAQVDFMIDGMRAQESLLRHILSDLRLPMPALCDMQAFMETISDHLRDPAVILMDEIGAALQSAELDQQFWWNLRSLCCNLPNENLAFVVASQKAPKLVAEDYEKPSPFFNIFHTMPLGPLTEVEARELIASSPRPFTPADVEWILIESERWPSLLQILCYERLHALEHGEADDVWKTKGLQGIKSFRYLLGER